MLTIIVDRAKGKPVKFDWEATSEEFKRLWANMEELAESQGYNPRDVANQAIHMVATKGERSKTKFSDAVKRPGSSTQCSAMQRTIST